MTTTTDSKPAESINICGVLVHTRIENAPRVQDRLQQYKGVEVHNVTDDGRLVVTIENEDQSELVDTINSISTVEGVISAAMVYQHHE